MDFNFNLDGIIGIVFLFLFVFLPMMFKEKPKGSSPKGNTSGRLDNENMRRAREMIERAKKQEQSAQTPNLHRQTSNRKPQAQAEILYNDSILNEQKLLEQMKIKEKLKEAKKILDKGDDDVYSSDVYSYNHDVHTDVYNQSHSKEILSGFGNENLAKAVIMSEILAKPLALRERR